MADEKMETRYDRLDRLIAEGNLLRFQWTEGRDRACLLAALSPEVSDAAGTPGADVISACPASLMPEWLAALTPRIDDGGSARAWPAMVRRFAALARRWGVLGPEAWERLNFQARAIALRQARDLVPDDGRRRAIDMVVELCERGPAVTADEWEAARTFAAVAASRLAFGATQRARGPESVTADTVSNAAGLAESTDDAEAIWDTFTARFFDAIEAECVLAEAPAQGAVPIADAMPEPEGVSVDLVLEEVRRGR